MEISLSRLKALFSYGWKVLVSGVISTITNEMRTLLIGKIYLSDDLAFYNKGSQFPGLVINNINNAMSTVLFPTMSNNQDRKEYVRTIVS
jgi:O-antigen/teichoic acid export membrane protein